MDVRVAGCGMWVCLCGECVGVFVCGVRRCSMGRCGMGRCVVWGGAWREV